MELSLASAETDSAAATAMEGGASLKAALDQFKTFYCLHVRLRPLPLPLNAEPIYSNHAHSSTDNQSETSGYVTSDVSSNANMTSVTYASNTTSAHEYGTSSYVNVTPEDDLASYATLEKSSDEWMQDIEDVLRTWVVPAEGVVGLVINLGALGLLVSFSRVGLLEVVK